MKKTDVEAAIYAQRSYTNAEIAAYFEIPVEELNQAIADYRAGKLDEPKEEPKPKPRTKKKTD